VQILNRRRISYVLLPLINGSSGTAKSTEVFAWWQRLTVNKLWIHSRDGEQEECYLVKGTIPVVGGEMQYTAGFFLTSGDIGSVNGAVVVVMCGWRF
jgi:hypothetical protein